VLFRKPPKADSYSKPLHLQAPDYPFQADLTRFSSFSIIPSQGLHFFDPPLLHTEFPWFQGCTSTKG